MCSEQRKDWDSDNLIHLKNRLLGFVLKLNPSLASRSLPSVEKHFSLSFSGLSVNTLVLTSISPDTGVYSVGGVWLHSWCHPVCVDGNFGKDDSLGMWFRPAVWECGCGTPG